MIKRYIKQYSVSVVIIAICVVWTLLSWFSKAPLGSSEKSILYGAYYKPFIACGQWWRMITAGFLHGSVTHLLMNMFALYTLGTIMENRLGKLKFVLLLLGSTIGGHVFMFIAPGNPVSVGLSGGLYGLMASYVYIIIRVGGLNSPEIRRNIMEIIMINVFINFIPGIAYMAHIGGFITGFIMTICFDKDPMIHQFRKNTIIASICLLGVVGYLMNSRKQIPVEQAYIGTDINLVSYELQQGHTKRALRLAKNLNDYYDLKIFDISM